MARAHAPSGKGRRSRSLERATRRSISVAGVAAEVNRCCVEYLGAKYGSDNFIGGSFASVRARVLTDKQLRTVIRLQRIAPHARIIAVADLPSRDDSTVSIAMEDLRLDACFYVLLSPDFVETALGYRADYLREARERASQGKARP